MAGLDPPEGLLCRAALPPMSGARQGRSTMQQAVREELAGVASALSRVAIQPVAARIRVLIVDDHKLFAEAIRSTLSREGIEVVDIAMTADEALASVRQDPPDLVLMDIGLPDQSGLVVGARILEECPQTRVVVLSALDDPWLVQEAVRAGFHGYLTKDTKVTQFVESLRAVAEGEVVLGARIARPAAGLRPRDREAELLARQLTPREREVLEMLTQGATGQDIADSMSITANTVRTHVQSILAKLQVHSRLEAAAFAVRHGLVRVGRVDA